MCVSNCARASQRTCNVAVTVCVCVAMCVYVCVRRCQDVLSKPDGGGTSPTAVWCHDFLVDDGETGRGSCCTQDEELIAWCSSDAAKASPLYAAACDPTSLQFAMDRYVLSPDNTSLAVQTAGLWDQQKMGALWPRLLAQSPICEVLGQHQRLWLQRVLAAAAAASPLTIVGSGSVLLAGIGYVDSSGSACSSDDLYCYSLAQVSTATIPPPSSIHHHYH